MSDYTLDMFCADHDQLLPRLQAVESIELSKDEWPEINIGGTIYAINPNFSEFDTIMFFNEKYGRNQGFDYSWRFLQIIYFIDGHRKNLIKDKLIRNVIGNRVEVVDALLQVMLDSFSPGRPPATLPKSSFQSKSGEFNYSKVLKATKSLMKE